MPGHCCQKGDNALGPKLVKEGFYLCCSVPPNAMKHPRCFYTVPTTSGRIILVMKMDATACVKRPQKAMDIAIPLLILATAVSASIRTSITSNLITGDSF